MVPGKDVLAKLNSKLQDELGATITDAQVCSQFTRATVPSDVKELLDMLDAFGVAEPPDA